MSSSQRTCYQVVEGRFCSPEGEMYIGYGIRGEYGGSAILLADLSRSREPVEELVRLLEEKEVSFFHLRELVEEWLDRAPRDEE